MGTFGKMLLVFSLCLFCAERASGQRRGGGGGSRGGGGRSYGGGGRSSGGGGAGYGGSAGRPGGGMTRPMTRPGASLPGGGGAAYRPGPGGGGMSSQRPGSATGSNRPGSGYRPDTGGITRPSPSPGGGNRPGTGGYRPGAGGNRPGQGDYGSGAGGNRPGIGGDRPGAGGNRPGAGGYQPGPGGNRPGAGGNRPGLGDNRPGAGGGNRPNRPGSGDNLGVVNRPGINRPGWGWGGIGNNRWGGAWRRPGLGWGRFNSPFLGNWYRGSWGWNRFGGWFGPASAGIWGGGWPTRLFPTWRFAGLAGWGLGPWTNGWLYSGFANPYFIAPPVNTPVVANWPPVFVPDYSRPLDLTSVPPGVGGPEQDDSTFLAAREAFKGGDFARALALSDLALKPQPNEPVLHEFRALCLFALARYSEAAAALYVVLTAGPGWDWTTMVGLYPDLDTYTSQLRALEAAIEGNASVASKRFVLAYHYMVQDHVEQARQQFEYVVQLQPKDELATQFVKLLTRPSGAPTVAATGAARATDTAEMHEPSPPPAVLLGTWKAKPMPNLTIELTLRDDGQFTWDVSAMGHTDSIAGHGVYRDGILTLTQADAPDLVGNIIDLGDTQFGFELQGGPHAAAIQFSR
jgi:hypothetical protein